MKPKYIMGNNIFKKSNNNKQEEPLVFRDEVDWGSINYDNTKKFSFNGKTINCKVVKVYDGDSVTLAFPFNNAIYRFNCRLVGIDTPELRSRDKLEKNLAYIVRDFLSSLILHKIVKVDFFDMDKYGRPLIKIFTNDNICVNTLLIEKEYAIKYDGGTKADWCCERANPHRVLKCFR